MGDVGRMISTSVVPVRRDLDLLFRQDFSPASQSEFLADAARRIFADADAVNKDATGQTVPSTTYVDGRGAWSSQAPDGVYHAAAELMGDQFRRLGSLSFGYRELVGVEETTPERRARPNSPRDLRQPALIIVPS